MIFSFSFLHIFSQEKNVNTLARLFFTAALKSLFFKSKFFKT